MPSTPPERGGTLDGIGDLLAPTQALPVSWVDSQDVTDLVMFLVSDEAKFITGTSIRVDAGAVTKR